MGGRAIDSDCEIPLLSNEDRTVVLVGRTGNGKSATGNSILGRKAFKSRASSSGVTRTCELQNTVLRDGRTVNVIDTPGLFDYSANSEFVGKEIVRCIDLAKDGIHAIILVLTVRTRFSREEEAALRGLQEIFGNNVVDYMIVVFTGGDELEENNETLEDYLGRECPDPLKEILDLCKNRRMLFDNKTKDDMKKSQQVQQLFSLVNMVMSQNGGKPFTHELFAELKDVGMKLRNQQIEVDPLRGYTKQEIKELKDQMKQSYDDQLKRMTETIESKMKEQTTRLHQQLAEEQAARLKAEENAMAAQRRSDEEIRRLRVGLREAQQDLRNQELRSRARVVCPIL